MSLPRDHGSIIIDMRDLPSECAVISNESNLLWPPGAERSDNRTTSQADIRIQVLIDHSKHATLLIPTNDSATTDLLLLHEAQHRARNLVALVVSLAHQSLAPLARQPAVSNFIDRLQSLDLVARTGCEIDGDMCNLGVVLKKVTSRLDNPSRPQITLQGAEIELAARWAHLVAIVTHELAANAVRHGALSFTTGHVDLRWSIVRNAKNRDVLQISWRERGGPAPPRTIRSGFGMRILRDLPSVNRRLNSVLRLEPMGLSYDFSLELCASDIRMAL